MQKRVCHKRFQGFTLIELLVVITIILILAAILFPVFAAAKFKGYEVSCVSNLKQLGLAFMMYAGDYDGAFPESTWVPDDPKNWGLSSPPLPATIWISWDERLNYGYVKSYKFWTCPGLYKGETLNYGQQAFTRNYGLSADYIIHGSYSALSGNSRGFWKIRDYKDPSNKILLAEQRSDNSASQDVIANYNLGLPWPWLIYDAVNGTVMPPVAADGGMVNNGIPGGWCLLAWDVHNKGSNYLMSDGHVRHMKYAKTVSTRIQPNGTIHPYTMWNAWDPAQP